MSISQNKPTFQYSVDESYVAGINVPPRIYRIKTEVSENGGEIKDKEKVYEVNKKTGEKVSVVQDQTKNYTKGRSTSYSPHCVIRKI